MAIDFPTTAWSMVKAAGEKQGAEYVDAVNRFACGYWKPIFYYVRCRGYRLQDAEDLTQQFFARFLESNWISKVDQQKGKFRQYLLTVLKRFIADEGGSSRPRQKEFEGSLVAISTLIGDEERCFEPSSDTKPDEVYSDQWAQSVLATVQKRLAAWCQEKGRPDWQQIFDAVYFPEKGSVKATQGHLADEFNQSRDQIRYALQQTSEQFQLLLRVEIKDQVWTDGEIETEIRDLMKVMGRKTK